MGDDYQVIARAVNQPPALDLAFAFDKLTLPRRGSSLLVVIRADADPADGGFHCVTHAQNEAIAIMIVGISTIIRQTVSTLLVLR